MRLFTSPGPDGKRPKNLIYSTVKKSGKTAIAALLARHAAETGPPLEEIYCAANDLDQAANRVFQAVRQSIEADPAACKHWQITEHELRFSNGTFIRAIASDYKGEAGANPRLTVWTELWGFEHERMRRLFEELTPVPTQESIRIIETSAGYEGQSDLLRSLFELGKEGKQLTAGELSELTGAPLGCFVEAPNPDSPVPVWRNRHSQPGDVLGRRSGGATYAVAAGRREQRILCRTRRKPCAPASSDGCTSTNGLRMRRPSSP